MVSVRGLLSVSGGVVSRWRSQPEEGRVDGEEAHPAGSNHQRAIEERRALGEERRGGEPPRRRTQQVEESPAEGGGSSSRLPEESWWERRLPPLYSEQELVPSTAPPTPGPPGEISIRLHAARPGCRGNARRGATPLQPAETRRRRKPSVD